MHITLPDNIKCGECGSDNYESFSDRRYRGIRCKACGHESKELHEHLKPQSSGGTTFTHDPNKVSEF
jgi:rubredoxin